MRSGHGTGKKVSGSSNSISATPKERLRNEACAHEGHDYETGMLDNIWKGSNDTKVSDTHGQ
jgi:hypothetical protein